MTVFVFTRVDMRTGDRFVVGVYTSMDTLNHEASLCEDQLENFQFLTSQHELDSFFVPDEDLDDYHQAERDALQQVKDLNDKDKDNKPTH